MASSVILGSRRFLHPGPLRWLRALGWMLLLGFLLTLCFSLVAGGILGVGAYANGVPYTHIGMVPITWQISAIVTGVTLTVLAYAGLVRLAEGRWPYEYSLPHMPVDLIGGIAAGAGMQALAVAGLALGGWVSVTHQPITDWLHPIPDTIQSGFIEEMVFRLVILRLVWRAFGVWPALLFSATLFGAAHLNNPNSSWFAALCIAVEAGVMLATFYIVTGRVWASVGVHMGWNYTQGWIFGAAVSGTSGFTGGPLLTTPVPGVPDWLSGGSFGPEASLSGLVVGTVFGVALLIVAIRRGQMVAADQRPAEPDTDGGSGGGSPGDDGFGGAPDAGPDAGPGGGMVAPVAVAAVAAAATLPQAADQAVADDGGSSAALDMPFSDPVM